MLPPPAGGKKRKKSSSTSKKRNHRKLVSSAKQGDRDIKKEQEQQEEEVDSEKGEFRSARQLVGAGGDIAGGSQQDREEPAGFRNEDYNLT